MVLPVPQLTVELVPRTAWYSNVRTNVTRKEWEVCKTYVKTRSGGGDPRNAKCEICGGRGSRYPVDCHEVWRYDDQTGVQTLADLIALCPACHEVKHIGLAEVRGRMDDATAHLARVNGWTMDQAIYYLGLVFTRWNQRSQRSWKLDISMLHTLGLEVPTGVVMPTGFLKCRECGTDVLCAKNDVPPKSCAEHQ